MSSGFTTRRDFLKVVGVAGALAGAGSILSACSKRGSGGSGSSDVTLAVSPDGPYGPMPTDKEQKDSIGSRAYAESLQAWLKKNPGVKLKKVSVNVWDQDTIRTALTGGTAPAAFISNVIGGWDAAGIRSAFLQGLAADVTPLVDESQLLPKLADYAKPIWEKSWSDQRHLLRGARRVQRRCRDPLPQGPRAGARPEDARGRAGPGPTSASSPRA